MYLYPQSEPAGPTAGRFARRKGPPMTSVRIAIRPVRRRVAQWQETLHEVASALGLVPEDELL